MPFAGVDGLPGRFATNSEPLALIQLIRTKSVPTWPKEFPDKMALLPIS